MDTTEYKREREINNILMINGKKCEYINYPLSNFNNNNNDIIVYNVMYDLYELCKLYGFCFEDSFKNKIIEHMRLGIEFLHDCGYIHTDIKINNFLLDAMDIKQYNILNYVKTYNFKNILNKKFGKNNNIQILEIINKELLIFIDIVYKKFNLNNSENENDSKNEINSENNSENNLSSYDTGESSFNSYYNEYDKKYDKFHIDKIFDYNTDSGSVNDDIINNDIKKNFLNKYLSSPILKLTDFGLIKKNEVNETTNVRNYRCPKIILGYRCDKELDFWSLDMTIYELNNGKMLYRCNKTDEYGYYNNDLISIKLILEKTNKKDYNKYIDLIKNSNRTQYFLSNDGSLLYYKKLFTNKL